MFMNNDDGLNLADSPFKVQDGQATGQSYNYDYNITGAITKVLASRALNSSPDTQLKSLGIGVLHSTTDDSRTVVRAAGTKIQTVDPTTGATTNVTDDTVSAVSDFLGTASTQPVVFAPFNTNAAGTQLWMAGGDLSALQGFTGSTITANGTPVPTGSISTVVNLTAGGSFLTTGKYFYAVTFRKLNTQVIGNAALDVSATITSVTDTVTVNLSTISNNDTTRYDDIYIYRSAVGGFTGFTTGDLIAQIPSTSTNYTDTGSYITTASNIPRAAASIDNSVLPAGTFKYVTTFKRRLITCLNSTLYISDLDKPQSFPLANYITLPTGGPITALGTVGVPSEYTTGADQYLCIWKEDELWVLTGDSPSNWELLFVDKTGCVGQSLVVPFNGFITWVTYNGVYVWDGKGKPSRISRPIQTLFGVDGDLDKSRLYQGYGAHYKQGNQVIWKLSSRVKGIQQYSLKMDTRLSATKMYKASPEMQNPELDGAFIQDTDAHAYYAICSFKPTSSDEILLLGDDSGYIYNAFNSGTGTVSFAYETKHLDMGMPQNNKRWLRLLVFVERIVANDLTAYYWTDNRIRDEYRSKSAVSMSPTKGTQPALWDLALWDQDSWDDYTPDISPLEFQLHSYENNAEGSSLKIRFSQIEGSAPVRIYGFAIDWEDMGPIPVPTQQI